MNPRKKIEALWEETWRQIDELTARPTDERTETIQALQMLEGGQSIRYSHHTSLPYYQENAEVEIYVSDKNSYTVDIATSQIIEVFPLEQTQYNVDVRYAPDDLEKMARAYIEAVAGDINFDKLTPAFGNKEEVTYFFRWEDHQRKLSDGMAPFIQVGFSVGGDFLNYVNTLPFTENNYSDYSGEKSIASFSEIYANGSSTYWSKTGSMITVENAGYCHIAGWCSPKHFYYKLLQSDATGKWFPNPNSNVEASAFIPSTNATATAKYYVYRTGLPRENWSINQDAYFNTWVRITKEGPVADITQIRLTNTGSSTTIKVAWDEVWVYTP